MPGGVLLRQPHPPQGEEGTVRLMLLLGGSSSPPLREGCQSAELAGHSFLRSRALLGSLSL